MRKRIAGAIGVAALTGAILVSCSSSSGSYTDDGTPEPARTFESGSYVTKVQIDGVSVNCVVYRDSISCDFAGDIQKRESAQ